MKFVTPGVVAGTLTFVAAIAGFLGKPALAAFFSDPSTAQTASGVLIGAGALVSGFLQGVKTQP